MGRCYAATRLYCPVAAGAAQHLPGRSECSVSASYLRVTNSYRCALLPWWAGGLETSLARSPRVPRVLLRLAVSWLLWLAGVVRVVALHLLPPRPQRVLPARRLRVRLCRLCLLSVRPPLLRVPRVLPACLGLGWSSLRLRPLRVLGAARRRSSPRTRCPRAR